MSKSILIDRVDVLEQFCKLRNTQKAFSVLQIEGPAKMGKTRLVTEFMRMAQDEWSHLVALIDLKSESQYADMLHLISEQLDTRSFPLFQNKRESMMVAPTITVQGMTQLFSKVNVQASPLESRYQYEQQLLTSAFCTDLKTLCERQRVLILIDTIDQAIDETCNWIYDKLFAGLSRCKNLSIVMLGREVPKARTIWARNVERKVLEPVTLAHHVEYCQNLQMNLSEEVIKAFHQVFEGVPGLFAEYSSKLISND